MIIPLYFTDNALEVKFNITLDGHLNNHANSMLTIKQNFSEIETSYRSKILKEMATIYSRLKNQYKFK